MTRKRAKPAVSRRVSLPLLIVMLAAPHWTVLAQQPGSVNSPVLDDVDAAFSRIETGGAHVTACASGLIPKPLYRSGFTNFLFGLRNHFQGIQRLPQPGYVAISGASRHASDVFIVRFGNDDPQSQSCDGEVVSRIEVEDAFGHAGGLSMVGSILAVPVHRSSPRAAKVAFFDLVDPEAPRRLPVEIARPGRKATATAVTRLPNGHYLVAVLSAYDRLPRRLDFYLSRSTVLDEGFHPDPVTWRVSGVEARPGQEGTFSHFQSINFIQQTDGRLYLVGFHNNFAPQTILPGRDYADLYEVAFPKATTENGNPVLEMPTVTKVANRMFHCTEGFCSFSAAAGLFIDPTTRTLSVYSTPGWLDGDTVKVTVYPSSSGASSNAR